MTGEARVATELAKATTRQEVLGLAIGAGSSCWSNLEDAGEFDSAEAARIVDATLEAFQRVDTVPDSTMGVILQVRAERTRQIEKGYTPEHDDEHGLEHILSQVNRTATTWPPTRANLERDAGLLVAAIEWYDRHPDYEPPAFETDEPTPSESVQVLDADDPEPPHLHTFWIDGGDGTRTESCRCSIGADHADPDPWGDE